jgi:hypothetical protein
MSEHLPEATPPQTVHPPMEPGPEIARRNTILGLALLGLVLVIAGGAVLVAFIYLHYD